MSLQKKSYCKCHYKGNLIVKRITKEILWQRSRISLGHDPADTCPQRTICKINSNCDYSVGPVGELITEVLHVITKEIPSQISLQKKSHCEDHYKGNLIVNLMTKEILL